MPGVEGKPPTRFWRRKKTYILINVDDLNATISYQGWDAGFASARFEQNWTYLYYDVDVNIRDEMLELRQRALNNLEETWTYLYYDMTMTYHIRDEMLELRQRALNKIEEEGMSSFNPADVDRLRNNDGYVERQDWFTKIDLPVDVNLKRLNKESSSHSFQTFLGMLIMTSQAQTKFSQI